MGNTLTEIAQKLKNAGKRVQLIYAFNGVGKTRMSREFKELVAPKIEGEEQDDEKPIKVLYYNAFTEDLFYWDNDLDEDIDRKLIIHPNSFTDWIFKDQGQEYNIITYFQHYTNDKLTPSFNQEYTKKDANGKDVLVRAYSEVKFSLERGDENKIDNIKISKGEESCLIWCVFYSLLKLVVETLNEPEPANRDTNQFDELEYIFIDDPVSSLDENHLIELAVDIAELIKSSQSEVKFIITTHNPLFYNVLHNELNNKDKRYGYKPRYSIKYRLEKMNDGTYNLQEQTKDSPFSYHLFLLAELEKAIESDDIKKYHYNFLRQILEKTSTFLGVVEWKELLALLPQNSDGASDAYYNRIINLCSHGKHSGEEISLITENDKKVLGFLVREIKKTYHFKKEQPNQENANGTV